MWVGISSHFLLGALRSLMGATFLRNNLGKRSVAIDLKSDQGRELFLQLVPKFDVVAENFKAGTMARLGLDYDEGPFYQMQRLARYQDVAERLVMEGKAYRCYCSKQELDAMREAQRARGGAGSPRTAARTRRASRAPTLVRRL